MPGILSEISQTELLKTIMKRIITPLCLIFLCFQINAQTSPVTYTAKDIVNPYKDFFLFGSNLGYYTPWDDKQLADIAAGDKNKGIKGVGVNSLRPTLPHKFLDRWGLENKIDEFEHYTSLGIINNTVFIGYPSNEQRDWTEYCPDDPSQVFKRLYHDIWVEDNNGNIVVNQENYYARYLLKMVTLYKDHVKFWEIWNEPDLAESDLAWRQPGDPEGSWWDTNPQPCEFKLHAPIFSYIRMLRISYEVIKHIDPDAYIAVGGLGYPSFLDAIMRNTDNPNGGVVSADYPNMGGAYFDVMSFHSYPHIDGSLREWNNDLGDFDYTRHSDAAVDGLIAKKNEFEEVLHTHKYDGREYPEKVFIVTETNIPSKQFDDYIGSNKAQRNYLIKSIVAAQQNDIQQLCIYDLGEKEIESEASGSFDMMGLYESLEETPPYQQKETDGGIAYKTASDFLKFQRYDTLRTLALGLPDGIRGAAFKDPFIHTYTYVLWAETKHDQSEWVEEIPFLFPTTLLHDEIKVFEWNFSQTGEITTLRAANSIAIGASPIFIRPSTQVILPVELVTFRGYRENADVVLEWVTESEENNDRFIVEHSANARDFETIGELPGAGTTSITQYYTLKHNRALRGNNYYRLKQIDTDGTFEYSQVVVVNIESEDLFTVRPTQADDEIHVEFYDYYDRDIELVIYDVLGRKRMDQVLASGRNALSIDVRNLDAGHYFIRMKVQGEDYFTRRFLKVKL